MFLPYFSPPLPLNFFGGIALFLSFWGIAFHIISIIHLFLDRVKESVILSFIGFGITGIYVIYKLVIFFMQEPPISIPAIGMYLGIIPWFLLALIIINLITIAYTYDYPNLLINLIAIFSIALILFFLIPIIILMATLPYNLTPLILPSIIGIILLSSISEFENWLTEYRIGVLILIISGIVLMLLILPGLGVLPLTLIFECVIWAASILLSYVISEYLSKMWRFLIILILNLIIIYIALPEVINSAIRFIIDIFAP